MKLKLIEKEYLENEENYEYLCPCGEGFVMEYIETAPGFRSHTAFILCEHCKNKYDLVKTNGYYNQVKEKSNA